MSIFQQTDKIYCIAPNCGRSITKRTHSKHIADSIGVGIQVFKEIMYVLLCMSTYCQILQECFFICMSNHTISTDFNDIAIAHELC